MSHASFLSIAEFIKPLVSVGATAIAAGAGDATETDGQGVDRQLSDGSLYRSAAFVLFGKATLAASKKATFKATIQDSADNVTFADVAAALQPEGAADSVVLTLTDSGAGSTLYGTYEFGLSLDSLNRYIRAQVHIDLNAGATDTGFYLGGFVLGGADKRPI